MNELLKIWSSTEPLTQIKRNRDLQTNLSSSEGKYDMELSSNKAKGMLMNGGSYATSYGLCTKKINVFISQVKDHDIFTRTLHATHNPLLLDSYMHGIYSAKIQWEMIRSAKKEKEKKRAQSNHLGLLYSKNMN